jgi:flagellar FliJ protein
MSRKPPWDRLKDLAAQRRDAQAQRLGALTRERDEQQRRLEMLLSYRSDYQARLTQASSKGIDLEVLRNYQSFLAQLERAIAQQSELVAQAERNVGGARQQWTSERARVESFQTLDERHTAKVARDEKRRAQKLTDEWSARLGGRLSIPAPDTEL